MHILLIHKVAQGFVGENCYWQIVWKNAGHLATIESKLLYD